MAVKKGPDESLTRTLEVRMGRSGTDYRSSLTELNDQFDVGPGRWKILKQNLPVSGLGNLMENSITIEIGRTRKSIGLGLRRSI